LDVIALYADETEFFHEAELNEMQGSLFGGPVSREVFEATYLQPAIELGAAVG
jgi:hypothetical protein